MEALISGQVLGTGAWKMVEKGEEKSFPYFDILQEAKGDEMPNVVRVSGNGVKTGDRFSGPVVLTAAIDKKTGQPRIKAKKIEMQSQSAPKVAETAKPATKQS